MAVRCTAVHKSTVALLLLKKTLPLKKQHAIGMGGSLLFTLSSTTLRDSHLFFGFGCRRVVELYRAMWRYSGHEFTAHGRGGCIFYRILEVTTDAEDWSDLV